MWLNRFATETARKTLEKEENAPDVKDEEEKLKKKLLKFAIKRAGIMHETVVCCLGHPALTLCNA
jgi:hypothetical protein